MEDTFIVTISFVVVTSSGKPFVRNDTAYDDVPYHAMVKLEREMATMLSNLVALGEENVKLSESSHLP